MKFGFLRKGGRRPTLGRVLLSVDSISCVAAGGGYVAKRFGAEKCCGLIGRSIGMGFTGGNCANDFTNKLELGEMYNPLRDDDGVLVANGATSWSS